MRRHLIRGIVWFLFLFLVACQSSTALDEPPTILYGQDICDECGMIISEERYAASYVTKAGEVRRFDDIGGMLAYDHKSGEDVHMYWVHDYVKNSWLDAGNASYVLDPGLPTPMGWGIAAFSDMAGAESYVAQHGGTVATFSELRENLASGFLDPGAFSDLHQDHDHTAESD